MNSQEIFIDQQSQSHVQQNSYIPNCSNHQDTDIDAYLTQFINVQLFKQDSKSISPLLFDDNLEKNTFDGLKDSTQNQQSSMENQENMNEFISTQFDKQNARPRKQRKERPTDHNVCKKFHTIANKCLRSLKIYNFIKSQARKIHKRNYFILILIVADKTKKLPEFKIMYEKKIKEEIQKCQSAMGEMIPGSTEHRNSFQLIQSIKCSLKAIEIYQKGHLFEAVLKLFNVQKMKRQGWIQQAFAQVSKFGETIQMVLERVLTRF